MAKFDSQPSEDQSEESGQAVIDRAALFGEISDALDADLFIYSGSLGRKLAGLFVAEVERDNPRENVALVLCTYGGDADAAYIIARYLKNAYKKFTLYVFGFCKSAGTLIALGADEIVMSHKGELGPLDVQVLKTDELLFRGSGLDMTQAITSLSEKAYEVFEKHFFEIIKLGQGAITTKTAADLASHLAVDLIKPITGQIDPLRVGEVERQINIAYEYGTRLNNNSERVHALIRGYPSHTFVIDYVEAKSLFGNVRSPTQSERLLEHVLRQFEEEKGTLCITRPNDEGMIGYLKPKQENENEAQQGPNADSESIPKNLDQNGNNSQASGEDVAKQLAVAG